MRIQIVHCLVDLNLGCRKKRMPYMVRGNYIIFLNAGCPWRISTEANVRSFEVVSNSVQYLACTDGNKLTSNAPKLLKIFSDRGYTPEVL
jgi:hypothetical protein